MWAAQSVTGNPSSSLTDCAATCCGKKAPAKALRAYLSGDRESALVASYFQRFGLQPQKACKERINSESCESTDIAPERK